MADGLFSGFDPSRLYNVLKEQGLLPRTAQQMSPRTGSPAYEPSLNFLFTGPKPTRNTTAHEMSHSVQENLIGATAKFLEQKKDKTPQEVQFLSAYRKLLAPESNAGGGKNAQANKTAFDRSVSALYGRPITRDYDKYRTSPKEAQAWGVGSMSDAKTPMSDIRPHMDASYTTEFDILLSMYEKLPQQLKQVSANKRKGYLTNSYDLYKDQRKQIEDASNLQNLFSDPFAPTVN